MPSERGTPNILEPPPIVIVYFLQSFVEPVSNRAESLSFASDFIDLLRRLLCYDPAERITAAQALRHPYFNYVLAENGEVLAVKRIS